MMTGYRDPKELTCPSWMFCVFTSFGPRTLLVEYVSQKDSCKFIPGGVKDTKRGKSINLKEEKNWDSIVYRKT